MKRIGRIAAIAGLMLAGAAQAEPVTAFNFVRAETDNYFAHQVKTHGLGVLAHDREVVPIDNQPVVRMNRDTLYSMALYDLAAGPVTVKMPVADDGRFQSLQVISQDHYTPFVIYGGDLTLTQENVGTRYVMTLFRTFVDPDDPADLGKTHALQDAIVIEQAVIGSFEIPDWDQDSLSTARRLLSELTALGDDPTRVNMGPDAASVDMVSHLLATAAGWGLNPPSEASYVLGYPEQNNGSVVHTMTFKDVPVDGFWSISVYNEDGFFETNDLGVYSLNSTTATKSDDGSVTLQLGGCEADTVNCIPTAKGWNYALRYYRPRAELLDHSWTSPEAVPKS